MNNDELRDDAKILALTASLKSLIQILRGRDEELIALVASHADDLILDGDIGDDALKDAAVLYRRKQIFAR